MESGVGPVAHLELLRDTREKTILNSQKIDTLIEDFHELKEMVKALASVESRIARLETAAETRRAIRVAQWTALGSILMGLAALVVAFATLAGK